MSRSAEQKTAVLVLGAPRSGTSAICHMLSMLDVNFGNPDNFVDPSVHTHNPIFFELQSLNAVNEHVIGWFGHQYANFDFLPLREDFDESVQQRFIPLCTKLIQDEFGDAHRIGLKDPRFCFLLPLWVEGLRRSGYRVRCVWVARQWAAIAQSNELVNVGWTIEKNIRIAALSGMAAAYFLDGVDYKRIAYARALAEPKQTAVELAQWLGHGATDKEITAAASVLKSGLCEFDGGDVKLPAPTAQLSMDAQNGTLSPTRYGEFARFMRSIGFGPARLNALLRQDSVDIPSPPDEQLDALRADVEPDVTSLSAELARQVAAAQEGLQREAGFRENIQALQIAHREIKAKLAAARTSEAGLRQRVEESDSRAAGLEAAVAQAKEREARALKESFLLSAKAVQLQQRCDEAAVEVARQADAHAAELIQARQRETRALHESFWMSAKAVQSQERLAAARRNMKALQGDHAAMQLSFDNLRLSLSRLQADLTQIKTSTMWRVAVRVRGVLFKIPRPLRMQLRRIAKAAWWLVTPWRIPTRMRYLRERKRLLRRQG